jgi:hypothetical protein
MAIGRIAFAVAARFLGITRLVDDLWDQLDVDAKARNQLRDSIRDMLTQWVHAGGSATSRRLVVFIDDLDRCNDDVVIRVCEAVKLYLDAPGLIFVIACDLSVLARSASGPARGGPSEGRDYLEKIIQVAYRVPGPDKDTVRALIAGYGKRSGISDLLDDAVVEILSEATGRNPRRIKRIINSFVLEHHLDAGWRSLGSVQLITAILLQHIYPAFYSALINERAGVDPIGDFLDYADVRGRALNPPPIDDAWWSFARRVFAKRGLPPPNPDVGRVDVDQLAESLFGDVDYDGLASDGSFVGLLRGIGGPVARQSLRAHLRRSPLGTELIAGLPGDSRGDDDQSSEMSAESRLPTSSLDLSS